MSPDCRVITTVAKFENVYVQLSESLDVTVACDPKMLLTSAGDASRHTPVLASTDGKRPGGISRPLGIKPGGMLGSPPIPGIPIGGIVGIVTGGIVGTLMLVHAPAKTSVATPATSALLIATI
jgi:hypothetical protein